MTRRFHVEVQNEDPQNYPVQANALTRAAVQTLTLQDAPEDATLTVVITTDEQVRDLNRQYRGIDSATDVLSFPAGDPPIDLAEEAVELGADEDALFDDEGDYLGDILIAYPYASAQAQGAGHPIADSLALLVVHGTLHLLGYDHDTPENRAEMWAAQAQALDALGISQDLVPALEEASPHDALSDDDLDGND